MLFRAPSFQLLPVPHIQQQDAGECLAACAAMTCHYLGLRINYRRLLRILRIQVGIGAPLPLIQNLDVLGLTVLFQRDGSLEELYNLLSQGWPAIVGVQTGEFPYWNHLSSRHAVVVVGMDSNAVYVNDPEMPDAPIKVSIGDFMIDAVLWTTDAAYDAICPTLGISHLREPLMARTS